MLSPVLPDRFLGTIQQAGSMGVWPEDRLQILGSRQGIDRRKVTLLFRVESDTPPVKRDTLVIAARSWVGMVQAQKVVSQGSRQFFR